MAFQTSSPDPRVQKKSSRRLFLIMIFAICCSLVLGVGIYGYLKFDWFKSPKQIYLETEARGLTSIFTTAQLNYQQLMVKGQSGQAVHSSVNLTADLKSNVPMPNSQSEVLFEMFKHTSIKGDLYTDPNSKQFEYNFDVKPSGLNSIQLQAFSDGDKSASRIPQFYEKFLMFSSDKNSQVVLNNVPTKIITEQDLFNAISASSEEVTSLSIKDYEQIFVQSLNGNQVTMSDGTFSAKTTEIKGKEFDVVFTPSQLDALQKQLFTKLRNDQKIIDFLYLRYMKIVGLNQNSGLESKILDKVSFQKNYQSEVDELQGLILREKPDSGVKMIIRTDNQGNILEREITSLNSGQLYFRYANWEDTSGGENLLLSYSSKKGSKTTDIEGAYNTRMENRKKTGNILFKGLFNSPDSNTNTYFASDFTLSNSENINSNIVHLTFEQETNGIKSILYGNFDDKNTKQDSGRKATRETTVSLSVLQPMQFDYGPMLDLHMIQNNDFGVKVNLPQLNKENSVDMSNLPKDELNNLNHVIEGNVQKWLMNSPLISQLSHRM